MQGRRRDGPCNEQSRIERGDRETEDQLATTALVVPSIGSAGSLGSAEDKIETHDAKQGARHQAGNGTEQWVAREDGRETPEGHACIEALRDRRPGRDGQSGARSILKGTLHDDHRSWACDGDRADETEPQA